MSLGFSELHLHISNDVPTTLPGDSATPLRKQCIFGLCFLNQHNVADIVRQNARIGQKHGIIVYCSPSAASGLRPTPALAEKTF